MKRKTQILLKTLASALAVAILSGLPTLKVAFAAGPSIYISPGSSTFTNGSNSTISVITNTNGISISAVNLALTYDSSKLQVVSVSAANITDGANYADNGSGLIQGGAYKASTPYPSGTITLMNVTFKAKVGSGSTTLGFTTAGAYGTEVDNSDGSGSINAALVSGTVNFSQPSCPSGYTGTYPNCVAPTCPAGQTGTPPNCVTPTCPAGQTGTPPNCKTSGGGSGGSTGGTGGSTGSGSGSTGSTGSKSGGSTSTTKSGSGSTGSTSGGSQTTGGQTTPPKSNTDPVVTKQDIEYTKAAITATTTDPTRAYIQYGLSSTELNKQTATTDLGTSHQIALDSADLTPGQRYYYMIVTTDANGKVTKSQTLSFDTKGIDISVRILDSLKHPIANKSVTLHSTPYTVKTDDKGVALFKNVAPGSHDLLYVNGKQTYTKGLTVDNDVVTAPDGSQTAQLQNFSVVYGFTQTSHTGALVGLGTVVVLLALAAVAFFVYPGKNRLASLLAGLRRGSSGPVVDPDKAGMAPEAVMPGTMVTPVNPVVDVDALQPSQSPTSEVVDPVLTPQVTTTASEVTPPTPAPATTTTPDSSTVTQPTEQTKV